MAMAVRQLSVRFGALAAVALSLSCGGGGAAVPAASVTEPEAPAFAALEVTPASAELPVGGTVRLTASPRDRSGNGLSGLPTATFSSSDPATASVDATGLVTALQPGAVTIQASVTAQGVTRSASAAILITRSGGGAGFATLALTPQTASVPVGGTLRLSAVPMDASGNPLAGLPAPSFRSADPTIASVDAAGTVTGLRAGQVQITAELAAQGVTRSAIGSITVTEPLSTTATVSTPDRTFNPGTVRIAAGGTVTWQIIERRHNITFTGRVPPGGNVPDTEEGNSVSRTFSEPGEYTYECTRHRDRAMRGTVIVVAAENPRFASLSLTPPVASVAVGGSIQLNAAPLDQNGQPMTGLPSPSFSSSDPFRATVDAGGRVTGVAAGTVTITASLTAGGVSHQATATVTVGGSGGTAPGNATVTTPGVTFSPSTVTIGAGGTVTWQFSGARHNVIFRSAAPPGGNIPDTDPGSSVSRTFTAAGTYDYDCTRHNGMSGRVVVQ
jgi:trimeric autotransporter adhesin